MPRQQVLVYLTAIVAAAALVASGSGATIDAAAVAAGAANAPLSETIDIVQLEEDGSVVTRAPTPAPAFSQQASDASAVTGNLEFSATDAADAASASALDYTPCQLRAPTQNECIKGLFHTLLPQLKSDLPAYGMSAIDPYYYRRGIFRYTNDGIAGGLLIKNMYIHGISTLLVRNVLANFTETGFIIKLNVELPRLQANGQFKADVKFGGLRLVPKGPFNITIDNVKATILSDGVLERSDDGERRLQLRRLNANVAVGNAHITANGIFTDKNLNAMILNLVNENLPEITRVGIPATREQWAPILVAHVNEFFANVPIDKFLLQQIVSDAPV